MCRRKIDVSIIFEYSSNKICNKIRYLCVRAEKEMHEK